MDKDDVICHIYGQQMWHDSAYIVGNKKGLENLRVLIDLALEKDEAVVDSFYPKDFEGYKLYVACVEESVLEELELPYYDENYYQKSDEEKSPVFVKKTLKNIKKKKHL